MGTVVELLLLAVLCVSVGRVQGECRHVRNEDMLEYSCVGGQLSDLNSLPESTGKIRITDMPISRITGETFSRFGSELWVLGCSHCGIVDIEPGAFRHLDNLQQLSLDNNHLTTVRESWFRGLNYLTYLDLNYNNIRDIEDGVFRNLPSLIDLRLSGNRLECLNLDDMSNLRDLKRMFLTENPEFKCPDDVSEFLESRGVNYEKDIEWYRITEETDETPVPTTPLPTFRERLHLTSVAPLPPVESTPSYTPPSFQTTEDVVYRPVYPSWTVPPEPETTSTPEERVQSTTWRSPYGEGRTIYTPPGTIAPLDPVTHPRYDTTPNSLDATTSRSWPRFPESTSARPSYPVYPPHENENTRHERPYNPSEETDMVPLAPGPTDRPETSSPTDLNMQYTTNSYRQGWTEANTNYPNTVYPTDNRSPGYENPSTDTSTGNHSVRPLKPEIVQPDSPDNIYQLPHYQHPVTFHPPPSTNNGPFQEVPPPGVVQPTTTDKPLPDCPTINSSPTIGRSFETIVLSILLVLARNVLVEGF